MRMTLPRWLTAPTRSNPLQPAPTRCNPADLRAGGQAGCVPGPQRRRPLGGLRRLLRGCLLRGPPACPPTLPPRALASTLPPTLPPRPRSLSADRRRATRLCSGRWAARFRRSSAASTACTLSWPPVCKPNQPNPSHPAPIHPKPPLRRPAREQPGPLRPARRRAESSNHEFAPPGFKCVQLSPSTLELHYYSQRQGLWPLAKARRGLG